MRALAAATRRAIEGAGIDGDAVEAIALDTTGSSVIPVDAHLEPLDDYYLWCDHRAWKEAAEITAAAREPRPAKPSSGAAASYSSEWGFAKLLHWLRHNPEKRGRFATALEHCDMVAAVLVRHRRPGLGPAQRLRHGPQVDVERGAGRPSAGGVPDGGRSAARRRARETGWPLRHLRPDRRPLSRRPGPSKLGLRAGIPIPVGAFDAHWDAIGAGVALGDVVNVVGTSTCIMAIGEQPRSGPRRLRRGPGLDPPALHRHRSRAVRHRRHLRRHRAPRRHHRRRTFAGPGELPRRRDRPAAPHLGQRRPHRAGEPRAGRRHARLAA